MRPAVQPLPGKIKTVAIPVFNNDSYTERVGAVVTDAFSRILQQRTDCAIVPLSEEPEGLFVGRVVDFSFTPSSLNATPDPSKFGLPENAVLVQEFALRLTVQVSLQDRRTGKFIWSKTTTRGDSVPASAIQLEAEGASMNALINDSRGRVRLRTVADRWAEDVLNELIARF